MININTAYIKTKCLSHLFFRTGKELLVQLTHVLRCMLSARLGWLFDKPIEKFDSINAKAPVYIWLGLQKLLDCFVCSYDEVFAFHYCETYLELQVNETSVKYETSAMINMSQRLSQYHCKCI